MPNDIDNERRIADLERILDVTRAIGATVNLDELLGRIVSAATTVLDCERATVFLLDRSQGELCSRVATGIADSPIREIRFPVGRGIAGEVAETGRGVNAAAPYADHRFNPEIDRQSGFRTTNLLTLPLMGHDGSIVGVLQALNKRGGPFTSRDESLLATLSAQAGVAVARQGLLEAAAVEQRMRRDLEVAREIQQGLLPKRPPDLAGWDVAGWTRPADETGGDCYDWLGLPDGRILVMIGDAAGHGIGPALVSAEARALLRGTVTQTQDLPRILPHVNDLLAEDLREGTFVTAFVGFLDPAAGEVEYASAGHGPILSFSARTGSIVEHATHGTPLGLFPGIHYDPPSRVGLLPGDMLLLFTDGFFEWANPNGEPFGHERLAECVRRCRDRPAAEIIQAVYDAVVAFSLGTKQADDCSAVVVKRVAGKTREHALTG
jgi:phosphoserine phosphatase